MMSFQYADYLAVSFLLPTIIKFICIYEYKMHITQKYMQRNISSIAFNAIYLSMISFHYERDDEWDDKLNCCQKEF